MINNPLDFTAKVLKVLGIDKTSGNFFSFNHVETKKRFQKMCVNFKKLF